MSHYTGGATTVCPFYLREHDKTLAGGNLRAVPFPALSARQCGRDEVRTVRRRKRGKAMRL